MVNKKGAPLTGAPFFVSAGRLLGFGDSLLPVALARQHRLHTALLARLQVIRVTLNVSHYIFLQHLALETA